MKTEQLTPSGVQSDAVSVVVSTELGSHGSVFVALASDSQTTWSDISPAAARHLADLLNRAADKADVIRFGGEA